MLNKYQTKRQEGFTIIEVLIVLAIAGLIILIVFLAVPALQRNSRNTQRKNDASALIGAFQEFTNNNNGAFPSEVGNFVGNAKLGIYTVGDVDYPTATSRPTSAVTSITTPDTNKIYIRDFAKCDGNDFAAAANVTKRNVVAVYWVETSGGAPQMQCLDM